ncbi:hypothetical protein F9B85_09565 [Heliorestis acidaminivorans]|uniref:Phage holin n=1 Tax=Heliorestis acidaminivorans TaxID=553427 RepID=A0A6I0F092_9FIRM|nr:phage holin, LLH family [Heliorestis acidaminivorans]KAB2952392.1 hypothetical protein F9B85_09565 [Heliorestis acidaminivorans]
MQYGDLMVIAMYILIFGLIAIVTFVMRNFGPAIVDYIQSKTTEQQREMLVYFARSAVVFARNRFGDLSGSEQFEKALEYLHKSLTNRGMPIERDEMEALIEWAYEEAKQAGLIKALSEQTLTEEQ